MDNELLPRRSILAVALVIGGLAASAVWTVAVIGMMGAGLWWALS